MRKLFIAALAVAALATPAFAQVKQFTTYPLQTYVRGPRLIDGSQLNQMVTEVNNLTGQGTPNPITGSLITGIYASTSATPGTIRDIYGKISIGAGLNMTSGNLVGSRGEVDIPTGTTVSNLAAYLYGTQGKAILSGTVSAANVYGLMGQLDVSATTLSSSGTAIAVGWLDYGATSSTSVNSNLATNDSSILRMTNTTNATTAQIIEVVADAPIYEALGRNASGLPAYIGTTDTSCGSGGAVTATKALHITIAGTNYYIPLCPTL